MKAGNALAKTTDTVVVEFGNRVRHERTIPAQTSVNHPSYADLDAEKQADALLGGMAGSHHNEVWVWIGKRKQ